MRCPECGTETADPTRSCARCGAPAAAQPSVAAGPAAGQRAEPGSSPRGSMVLARCLECRAQTAEGTQVCAECGAPVTGLRPVAADPSAGRPDDRPETAPGAAGDARPWPAAVRWFLLSCLILFLILFTIGQVGVVRTPQGTGLHGTMVGVSWLSIFGALLFLVLFECARKQFVEAQLGWAAVPLLSFGFLAPVPFLWLALARRRVRDWVVFAIHLAATITVIAALSSVPSNTSIPSLPAVTFSLLLVIAPVHAMLAFSPAAKVPTWREASPKMLAAIGQVAERYGIPAELTGFARWRPHAGVAENPSESAPGPEAGGIILSEWAASRDFSTTRLRPGYDIEGVDAFVEAIRQTFLGIREPSLTPDEIRDKQFSTTRLRPGYDEGEVDAFLDAAELRLAALTRPGGHGGLLVLARCPECGMESADPARPCARCGAPAMQPSLAGPAAGQLAEDARPGTGDPHPGITRTAGGDRATPPAVSRPPIRRGVAFAGAGIALLAGAAGLVSQLLLYTSSDPGVYFFFLAAYLVSTGTAVAALCGIDRLVITGLLQGMCWPAVASVASDIALFSADHMYGLTGLSLAVLWVLVISDVLGAGAAVLLLISWSPAVGWRRVSRLRPLPVMLVCGVGLSQIASLILAFTQDEDATSETSVIAGLLVGLAVTWYAVNLRARVPGGALVLGWSTVTALWSLVMSPYTAIGILSSVLLAAVMVLALIYMRLPDTPAS